MNQQNDNPEQQNNTSESGKEQQHNPEGTKQQQNNGWTSDNPQPGYNQAGEGEFRQSQNFQNQGCPNQGYYNQQFQDQGYRQNYQNTGYQQNYQNPQTPPNQGYQQGYQQGYNNYGYNNQGYQPGYPTGGYISPKSRTTFGVLALLLGSFGVQYFYLNKVVPGLLCILFSLLTCWSIWPIVTFIQGIIVLASMSDMEFERKFVYTNSSFPLF